MSALNPDNNSMQLPKDNQNTIPLSPVDPFQSVQKYPGFKSISPVYEGFTFSKAMPKQGATWTCVKRTVMHLNQDEYVKMVQTRADQTSPVQQYQGPLTSGAFI
ncbi:hypothetical protein PDIG_10420 [Penicillium digitatum PHI26]|uniref:Uncharacterized protein n=2 Tax=Penicillium digitatum TaxID=36651 RepID=K9GB13_PEND2|nr:hypothetical protein PDIP_81930 [Penicillium digitatum Pd1]EKV05651.1 hypothetical protein PDIP_81930 [Penicillium digitatum Pd1]EKV18269.1 hypothetical protein PDIG_10420 [Penicillium digitatum PHI26]